MIRKLLMFVLLGSLPFMYSCKGEDGAIGPQGEQGIQGVQGTQGEKGAPATSQSAALQFSSDTASTDADGALVLGFTLEPVSAKAIEKGVILVYAKSGGFWFPLPGIVFFGDQVTNYTFLYQVDKLDLSVIILEAVDKPIKRQFQSVRVVIVPAANGRLSAEVDYKNYLEVQKAFELPE